MGIKIGSSPAPVFMSQDMKPLVPREPVRPAAPQWLQQLFTDGFDRRATTTALAAPAPALTQDKRGYPRGTVPVENGQVNIPGLGTFPAPAPGKTSKINLDKKNKLVLKRNADGTVSVQVKKRGGGFFGFLKKLGGLALKALPIASKILSFVPGLNAIAAPLNVATKVLGAVTK
jgi:hypothetical protein